MTYDVPYRVATKQELQYIHKHYIEHSCSLCHDEVASMLFDCNQRTKADQVVLAFWVSTLLTVSTKPYLFCTGAVCIDKRWMTETKIIIKF